MPENNQLLYFTQYQDAITDIYKNTKLPLMQVVDKSIVKTAGVRQVIPIIQKMSQELARNMKDGQIKRNGSEDMNSSSGDFWNTQLTSITSKNRINTHEVFAKATLVSPYDTMEELSDPTQKYVSIMRDFIEYKLNRVILNSLTAPVVEEVSLDGYAGQNGKETFLPSDSIVDAGGDTADSIFNALKDAKSRFDKNYVSSEDRFLICKSGVASSLLYHNNNANQLYAASLGVKGNNGDLQGILGFKIIQEENFGNTKYYDKETAKVVDLLGEQVLGIEVQRRSVALGLNKDISVNISDRPDKNLAKQLYVSFAAGGTRIYDEGVIVIKNTKPVAKGIFK